MESCGPTDTGAEAVVRLNVGGHQWLDYTTRAKCMCLNETMMKCNAFMLIMSMINISTGSTGHMSISSLELANEVHHCSFNTYRHRWNVGKDGELACMA